MKRKIIKQAGQAYTITLPIEWMLNNSNESCEVAGLHPLYRDPKSLENQTIVYCPNCRKEQNI